MKKLALRAYFALALAAVLAIGAFAFTISYFVKADDWVMFSGSPHVYSGANLSVGYVDDRDGTRLLDATDGKIFFRGEDITQCPMYVRARKGLGYLAQEPSVFRKLSVWDNVMAILETLPLSRKARDARAEELLAPFDLMKVAKQPAYTLSGGERRKLEIARALVRNPAILMLDEPFAGVDPLSVNEIQDIVRRLAAKGLGVIITDHNVRETLSVVNRAYLVYNGRLLREGTSDELVADPEVREKYLGENFRM